MLSAVSCLVTEAPGCETPLTLISWETLSRSLNPSESQVNDPFNGVTNVLKGVGADKLMPGRLDGVQHEVHI